MKSYVKVSVTKAVSIILLSILGSTSLLAQDINLENTESRTGYSIGVNIGLNLASQGILGGDVDNAALMQGIRDAIDDSIKLTDEEIIAALEQYGALMEKRAQEQLAGVAAAGEIF